MEWELYLRVLVERVNDIWLFGPFSGSSGRPQSKSYTHYRCEELSLSVYI